MVTLSVIERPIETETITVIKECHLKPKKSLYGPLLYLKCQKCPFLFSDKLCSWLEYHTEYKQTSYDTDKSGDEYYSGVIQYIKKIPCAHCGTEIKFQSGYSTFSSDGSSKEQCSNCGATHVFLRYSDKCAVFAVSRKPKTS